MAEVIAYLVKICVSIGGYLILFTIFIYLGTVCYAFSELYGIIFGVPIFVARFNIIYMLF